MSWIYINDIEDNEKILPGICVRIYNTPKGIAEQRTLPCGRDGHLDYILSEIHDNNHYFQLTCLSEGEGGNISSVLKKENDNYFVTGKEIKRILQTDLYDTFICMEPKIIIK